MLKNKIRLITIISVVLVLLTALPLISGCGKTAEFADPVLENILISMNNGDYQGFSKDFDANLRAELSEAVFPDFLAAVNGTIGNYVTGSKKITGVNISNGLTTATYKVDFEGMEDVTVDVVFQEIDDMRKVVGLWFK